MFSEIINRFDLLNRKMSYNIENDNMLLTLSLLEYHSI